MPSRAQHGERPSHCVYAATRRFGSLDGLRALAVLAVVWHHSPSGRGVAGLPATMRGYLGVDAFFVISGFLITTLLLRERGAAGTIRLGAFYARRTLRIFPLYYGVLAAFTVFFLVAQPDAPMAPLFFADLPYHATYTSNWIHAGTFLVLTWSLAAEEQFYLTWAPLVRGLGDGARWIAATVIAVGCAVTFGALDPALESLLGPGFRDLDMVQATFTPVALGCLAAWSLHLPRGFAITAKVLGSRVAAPLAFLAVVALASLPTPEPLRHPRPFVQLALTAVVIACVVREDHGLARALRQRALARVGVVSYGVYLLHIVALQVTRPLLLRWGVDFPGSLFLATALLGWTFAELSFRFWETPFLRWKERFRG